MNRYRRQILAGAVAWPWLQAGAAVWPAAAERSPLLVAHTAPSSGRFSLHAEADRRGVEMALNEANARGGLLGRELVLIARDPTLDPRHAAQVAEALIVHNRVAFMVGAISSAVAASMSAVATSSGATERRIGEDGLFSKKRKTLMFNGYEPQVGQLYAGMDLKKYY